MRLFLSIPVPVDLSKATMPLLSDVFRPVPAGTWHMTVRFLGDADPEPVRAAMDGFHADAMEASFTQVGAFPSSKKARVAWLGVQADGLTDVAANVRNRMDGIGRPDNKAFVAHVTLGRCERTLDLRPVLAEVEVPNEPFLLDRVDMMASTLTRHGPEYRVVRSWALN